MKAFAQKKRLIAWLFWAGAFLLVLGGIFLSRAEERLSNDADEQSLEIPRGNLLSNSFRKHVFNCADKETAIYAHFIQQTMNETVCFEDVINNQDGEMSCSPGPYRAQGHIIDPNGDKWNLNTTPDYFIWHLSSDTSEPNIYITNQFGFPVKSQVIRLQSEDEATMVLLPKAVLDKGSTYYIYLTFDQNHDKQTWVQPITIAAQLTEDSPP